MEIFVGLLVLVGMAYSCGFLSLPLHLGVLKKKSKKKTWCLKKASFPGGRVASNPLDLNFGFEIRFDFEVFESSHL